MTLLLSPGGRGVLALCSLRRKGLREGRTTGGEGAMPWPRRRGRAMVGHNGSLPQFPLRPGSSPPPAPLPSEARPSLVPPLRLLATRPTRRADWPPPLPPPFSNCRFASAAATAAAIIRGTAWSGPRSSPVRRVTMEAEPVGQKPPRRRRGRASAGARASRSPPADSTPGVADSAASCSR